MATDFEQLRREAIAQGMRAFERGESRESNPHKNNAATDEAEYWGEGWDNAEQLARMP